MYNKPIAYFITFSTYGTWLHGDRRNSVIVKNKKSQMIDPNNALKLYESKQLKHTAVTLNKSQRQIVLDTILRHCKIKNWRLYAVHIRSNHCHIILNSNDSPDKMMNDLKAWATRKLRQAGYVFEKVWTKHGSTIFIFTLEKLKEKVYYVVHEQGEKTEYFINDEICD